jgi:hypothetical protein
LKPGVVTKAFIYESLSFPVDTTVDAAPRLCTAAQRSW